jgi:hypothetical protein
VFITITVLNFFPVVPELFLPGKTVDVINSLFDHVLDNSLSMHIEHNKSSHQTSLLLAKVTSDECNHSLELLIRKFQEFFESSFVLTTHDLVDGHFDTTCPLDLIGYQNSLSSVLE